jgi:tetratricopeptide (TPR) repeat protein
MAFVGREREQAALLEAWRRAMADSTCELVTVVGDAGVGKSRLVAEVLAQIDARVVHGRCLPYGEGVGYWAVVAVLKQLDLLPAEENAVAVLRSLLGQSEAPVSPDEIAWAFRKTLERAAADEPLAVLLDDIQWGDENFLDLVEHVALLFSGAPLLVVCTARPELLDLRPGWPVTLRLDPLAEDAVDELLPRQLGPDLRERILRASGGNPLFVHEMVAMAEETEGEVIVPPNLQALLAARLDQLGRPERAVLERGAVEGEIFHRGSVQALGGDEQVTPRLAALVRKQLIRPDRTQLPGDDGFRFRHLLIRDAAYEALPKAARAELHAAFARWLEQHGQSLVELDEILAYHLDQAIRYREELGLPPDPSLVADARKRLRASGMRAYAQLYDYPAAIRTLSRALELAGDELDVVAEIYLSDAYKWSFRAEEAQESIAAFAARARTAGDRRVELYARLAEATLLTFFEPEGATERLEALIAEAEPELAAADDEFGLYLAARARGQIANMRGRLDQVTAAYDDVAEHGRRAGLVVTTAGWQATGRLVGTTPVQEMLAWIDTLDSAEDRNSHVRGALVEGLAMAGRRDEALSELTAFREELEDRGDRHLPAVSAFNSLHVAALAGDLEAAAAFGEAGCRGLEEQGERSILSSYAPELARVLAELGRLDEAEAWAEKGRALGAADDAMTQFLWRQAKAKIAGRRGDHAEAGRLAREAVEIALETDMLNYQGDAYADLGEVLALAGDTAGAAKAYERALDCYERKGNVVLSQRMRERVEQSKTAAS